MQPSIHYYVLSLNERTSRLYEGFRDRLIDIQDSRFPFEIPVNDAGASREASGGSRRQEFIRQTDSRFTHYHLQDPLRWVLVGAMGLQNQYKTLTTHLGSFIGCVEGEYALTSNHDLGKIVWPVVKELIAGTDKNAIRDLEAAGKREKVVFGIQAVIEAIDTDEGSILYVEEDYHVRGSIRKTDRLPVVSRHVNLREVIDDVVDVVIERVLQTGGNVIFLKSGSLVSLDRIAMILSGGSPVEK